MSDHGFTVISYNVCWEAMTETNTKGNPSAAELCADGNCRQNVLAWLNQDYDLCCLQEASFNYDLDQLPAKLNLRPTDHIVHSQSGPEPMLTIIDQKRWKILQAQGYEFSPGRPIQCLYLIDRNNRRRLGLINVHAGHDEENNIFNLWSRVGPRVEHWACNKLDGLIVAGDYNVETWNQDLLHENWLLSCSQVHNTCCNHYNIGQEKHKPSRPCDYIAHCANLHCEYTYSSQLTGPASDHQPIVSKLRWH